MAAPVLRVARDFDWQRVAGQGLRRRRIAAMRLGRDVAVAAMHRIPFSPPGRRGSRACARSDEGARAMLLFNASGFRDAVPLICPCGASSPRRGEGESRAATPLHTPGRSGEPGSRSNFNQLLVKRWNRDHRPSGVCPGNWELAHPRHTTPSSISLTRCTPI